jgi:hypothetical protein
MLATIADGHIDLADFLFLLAFIVFVIAVVLDVMVNPRPLRSILVSAGLALVALAWFVL